MNKSEKLRWMVRLRAIMEELQVVRLEMRELKDRTGEENTALGDVIDAEEFIENAWETLKRAEPSS